MASSRKSHGALNIVLLCALAAAAILAAVLYNYFSACEGIGEDIATLIGTAVGSYNGYREGKKDGIKEGLSAEDTTVSISNTFRSVGRLEVLTGDTVALEIHQVGGEEGELNESAYSAAYAVPATFVFTVDLTQAEIRKENDVITIYLPEPEVEINWNDENVEKKTEIENFNIKFGETDGVEEYLNSLKEMDENAISELKNYESLCELAKANAQRDVIQLVKAVRSDDATVQVGFMEMEKMKS